MPVRGHVDAAQWAAASDANYQHAANRLEHALARRADLVAEHERLVAEAQAVVDQAIADMANQASSGLAAHLPWIAGENEAPGQGLGSRPRPTQLRPRGLGTDGPPILPQRIVGRHSTSDPAGAQPAPLDQSYHRGPIASAHEGWIGARAVLCGPWRRRRGIFSRQSECAWNGAVGLRLRCPLHPTGGAGLPVVACAGDAGTAATPSTTSLPVASWPA